MARQNVQKSLSTHEGGTAKRINAELALRRSILACLLWERTFYEDGVEIADRIAGLALPPGTHEARRRELAEAFDVCFQRRSSRNIV